MKRNFLWASNLALLLTTAVPLRAADDAKVNTPILEIHATTKQHRITRI